MKEPTRTGLAGMIFSAVCLGCFLPGCGAGEPKADVRGMERLRRDELTAMAEVKLECDRAKISYRYEGHKVHLLEGCGDHVRYLVFPLGEVWVKVESFHERASFDLECDEEEVKAERLDEHTWQARGCGKSARYILTCERADPECSWLTDSPISRR